jgi:hypothetical protein
VGTGAVRESPAAAALARDAAPVTELGLGEGFAADSDDDEEEVIAAASAAAAAADNGSDGGASAALRSAMAREVARSADANVSTRKRALLAMHKLLFDGSATAPLDLERPSASPRVSPGAIAQLFPLLTRPLLTRFDDSAERCREVAILLWARLALRLSPVDLAPALPYLFPTLVERCARAMEYDAELETFVGNAALHEAHKRGRVVDVKGAVYRHDIAEPSEEVRLHLFSLLRLIYARFGMALLDAPIVDRHGSKHITHSAGVASQLLPYSADVAIVLGAALADPFADVVREGCRLAVMLVGAQPQAMKHWVVGLARRLAPALRHRHAKVRIAAIGAMQRLVACVNKDKRNSAGGAALNDLLGHRDSNVLTITSFYKSDASVNYCGLLCTDPQRAVRLRFVEMIGEWATSMEDRWDHHERLVPFLLTGLTDDDGEIRKLALRCAVRRASSCASPRDGGA